MNRRVSFGLAKTSAVASTGSRPTTAASSVPDLTPQDNLLLERFTAEIFASAVACTAVLSCFNAVQLDRTIILPAELRGHVPMSPMTFTAVLGSEVIELLHEETRAALSGYQYYIESGKQILNGHLEAGRCGLPVDYAALKSMQNQFKTGSLFALMTVKELGLLYSALRNDQWVKALTYLAADLNEATRGSSPYFNNGQFDVPNATDLMRGVRRQLNSEAVLTHDGVARKVHVRDVSQAA